MWIKFDTEKSQMIYSFRAIDLNGKIGFTKWKRNKREKERIMQNG